ncbi:MAG: outer membrane protein transport protein [Gammaproteobacteria bacterium]|nr:outer membrane protein transport protein [Gammaproteobacteria bacterium]
MKLKITTGSMTVAAVLANVLVSSQVHASGFALIEFSGSGMGNAFAGAAASAEDASTVQFNPAGMVLLNGEQMVGVLHYIRPVADFSNNSSTGAAILGSPALSGADDDGGRDAYVPNFYYVRDINEQMKFGFGMNTPFGLATQYDDNWVGRYHAVESDVMTVNFNPSLSYKLDDKLSLGFGVSAQYVDVILSSAVDFGSLCYAALGPAACGALGATPQAADGFATLTGDNWGYGWNMGVLYQFSKDTRLGLAYRSEVEHDVSGDADFTVPAAASFVTASGAFVDTGLKASITLPDSLSASVYHAYNSQLAVLADITWTGWSDFKELRIVYDNVNQPNSVTTEDWNNSLRYSLGANYRLDEKLLLRAGLAYDETPIPSAELRTPRVPGDNRTWLSFGAQYRLDNEFTIDLGYSHLFVSKTQINNTYESSIPTLAATLNGKYDAAVDILSAQVTWNF